MTRSSASSTATQNLVAVALVGLAACGYVPGRALPYTLRGVPGPEGPTLQPEGHSVRYTAIAALGLGRQPENVQREVLGGQTAADMARSCLTLAASSTDPGAHALALWAAAEVAGATDHALAARLLDAVRRPSLATVDCAWAVVAGLAMPEGATATRIAEEAVMRLRTEQGPHGTFPHAVPPSGRLRGHVGSFADQIYPVQAFARFYARTGEERVLAAAEATARRLVELQGEGGQWWWHYDARTGDVVERYPTYSVHQHGMAPMVLDELTAAGGTDHSEAVQRGYRWLTTHPECVEPLVAPELGVIWRKVGRREPFKAARAAGALVSRVRPGAQTPFVDQVLPAGRVDYECRPYELGWLLYASGAMHEGSAA
ncbi:MAG TPA: hypothetical protein VLS51_06230 [Propionibacteriaceae bacterium]|nr:hypothetical protein [Propionibacteriaceae bacterium]